MKPLWVKQFYNTWGFYPMAGGTLGDGSSWDETNPQQTTLANTLDSYDRDVRIGVRGRMALEHEWPSSQATTTQAGYHKFITLQQQASKPTIAGTQLGAIYMKTVGAGLQEAFWENEAGTEVQITNRGIVNGGAGSIIKSTYVSYITYATSTGIISYTASSPAYSSSCLVMTCNYTPLNATSVLKISGHVVFDVNNNDNATMAIHNTSGVAIAVNAKQCPVAQGVNAMEAVAFIVPATTGALLFNVCIGKSQAGTVFFNGTAGGTVLYGTSQKSYVHVEEIAQ